MLVSHLFIIIDFSITIYRILHSSYCISHVLHFRCNGTSDISLVFQNKQFQQQYSILGVWKFGRFAIVILILNLSNQRFFIYSLLGPYSEFYQDVMDNSMTNQFRSQLTILMCCSVSFSIHLNIINNEVFIIINICISSTLGKSLKCWK